MSRRGGCAWLSVAAVVAALGCSGVRATGTSAKVGGVRPAAGREWEATEQAVQCLQTLSSQEARAEIPRALEAYRGSGSPEDRLWLQLLLLKAPPGEADVDAAAEVLTPGTQGAVPDTLSSLLDRLVAERLQWAGELEGLEKGLERERETVRSLRTTVERMENLVAEARTALDGERAKMRSAQAERDEAAGRLGELEDRLDEERRRSADLEGQVEQLKAIEKLLERREAPAAGEEPR